MRHHASARSTSSSRPRSSGTVRNTPARRAPVRRRAAAALALLAAALLGARPAEAQSASGDGFLFREPVASLTLRGGFDRATARSDVFSFVTDQLTLGRGDFSGLSVGGDLSMRLAPRVDLVLGASYTGSTTPSEFRRFVDQDDQPIEQTTTFRRVPVTATLKAYLAPRGRSIGRFAWVPARYAPFVGVGGGAMWYRFRQSGDFVDFQTNDVFPDALSASRWTPTAHGVAGVDYSLSPRLALTGEGRYTWARARLSPDFAGFNRIDLSGVSATVGLSVRF
jgi:opacity protein-like surface antigen